MKNLKGNLLLLAAISVLLTSCGAAVAALLVHELLNDQAPKRTWTGRVLDSDGQAVGGVLVQIRAEVSGNDDVVSFSDETDNNGDYIIGFRWHKDVNYSIRVVFQENVLDEKQIGKIELSDQVTDFSLPPSA